MSVLLQSVFPQLWHSDPAVRLEASVQLVGHLEEAQKSALAHAATDDATTETEEAATSQQVDGLAADVSYALKRLIRGLASPRESSRIGFAVALTELLTRIPDILPRQVYPLIKSSSEIASGSKGSEERDLLFARLFAIHAIASSGFLFRSTSSLLDWRIAVEEVLYLGERKAWLRESAGWVIQGATRQLLQRDDVEWKDEALKVLIDAAFKKSEGGGSLEWTPERLALAVLLQNAGVQADWENITKSAFAEPQILSSSANLSTIARILRGLSTDETSKKANEQAQSAYLGTTQLHFVWTEILNVYFGAAASGSKKDKAKPVPVPFLDFYKIAVDGNLFTETASIPAKYVGLMAVKACLTTVDSATIPQLFTQNVLRTLMNHLAKGDRTLHGVAVQIARAIPVVAQANQTVAYDILLKLFNPPVGTIRFDALTRTKTVEGLVAALDIEGIKKYTNWLTSVIIAGDLPSAQNDTNDEDDELAEDEDEEATASKAKDTENRRLWAIDQLGLIVRKHAKQLPLDADAKALSTPEYSWTTRILQFFIVHGFTKVLKTTKKSDIEALRQKPEEPFTDSLQQAFRSRFFSALSHLVTVNTKCRSEPWAKQCLNTLLALQKDTKHVSPLTPQETVDSIASSVKLLSQVNSLADKQKAQYLSLFVEILVLLSFDPSGDAVDFLEQMTDAVEALINAQKPASSKAKAAQPAEDDEEEGEEAEPVSVLIDLLVELMQKSSVLLRTVSERVFSAASGEVTEQALQLLLDQIVPETFEMEEDDNDDEDASDDEDEGEGDAGEAATSSKKRKHKQVDVEESDESSDDDEDGDDDDDLDLEVDEELRAKILEALKESGVDEDQVDDGEGDDEEEEEDELLDDDQMMELDDKLAEIFKARKAASKSAKDAMQATHNAQLKVIDLLEIFAKQQGASPLILQTILPLFNAARRSGKEDVDISAKAYRVLNGIVSKAKEYPTVNNVEEVLEVLRSVHQGAARSGSEEIESLAIATSLYLCKIALATSSSEAATAVAEIYISSLNSFLIKKSCRLHGRFFESFINRFRDEAWQLREPLLEGCSESTKTSDKHRRATCFHLLSALLATHASQKSPEAKQEVIDFAPKYVQVFLDTFEAATTGKGMALQVIRLREILKACSEAVRATKNAIKVAPQLKTWDLWRSPDLNHIFTEMVQSTKIEKCGSLTSYIRNAMNLINQGSGQANLRNIKKGEPAMLPIGEDGKPITKLAARQRKKELKLAAQAERLANREASTKKQKPNKRKAETLEVEPKQSVPVVEDNGASTSEDSD